jgi:hypothetical protein
MPSATTVPDPMVRRWRLEFMCSRLLDFARTFRS